MGERYPIVGGEVWPGIQRYMMDLQLELGELGGEVDKGRLMISVGVRSERHLSLLKDVERLEVHQMLQKVWYFGPWMWLMVVPDWEYLKIVNLDRFVDYAIVLTDSLSCSQRLQYFLVKDCSEQLLSLVLLWNNAFSLDGSPLVGE